MFIYLFICEQHNTRIDKASVNPHLLAAVLFWSIKIKLGPPVPFIEAGKVIGRLRTVSEPTMPMTVHKNFQ